MIAECRNCKSTSLVEFLDLGKQYLSDFSKKASKFPLAAVFCIDCKLVQLNYEVPATQIYHSKYGFKSGISKTIRDDLDDIVTHAFQYNPDPKKWLDIGSNDGTLLSYIPKDIYRVGIDPVEFLCLEAEEYADRIIPRYFDIVPFVKEYSIDGSASYEKFDVITSISCFYDMPDPNQFVSDVVSLMSKHSIWVIQQNYLLTTMEQLAVDNFCHEHLTYYTLLALENLLDEYGLEVNEVYLSGANGGSMRTIVSYQGTFPVDESVGEQRELERLAGVDTVDSYQRFAANIGLGLDKLHRLVVKLHNEGSQIAILGASTRGATIWQSAAIDSKYIDFAVERNPAKVGINYSAINVPIIDEIGFRKIQPEYALVGPWFLAKEIIARELEYIKKGGSLILPLPEIKIIDKDNVDAYLGNLDAYLQTTP